MLIKQFIEDNFLVDDSRSGKFVPFRFNPVQTKYYKTLCNEYGEALNFNNAREIILKARKEGFTSLILAIFCACLMLTRDPVRYLEISYKDDATKQHFRRAKNYILSFFQKDHTKWTTELDRQVFRSITDGHEFVLNQNQASFYVGTASARTGERGGNVQGILFSESFHYPDTDQIKAPEIIEGTAQMVMVGGGMIFHESTANGFNHGRNRYYMAKRGETNYRARFYSYKEFYTPEQFAEICRSFTDKHLIPQEFPATDNEAFLSSGRPVFNATAIEEIRKRVDPVMIQGYLRDDKQSITLVNQKEGPLKIWKQPREEKEYLISADIAEGVAGGCWSVATVFDRASWEVVAELRERINPGEFGREMATLGEYYNFACILPELNNHGHATIEALRAVEYPHIVRTTDLWKEATEKYGFPTNERTKVLMITALRSAIENQSYKENCPIALDEFLGCFYDENGKVKSDGYTDAMISRAIGLYALKFLSVDETYRNEERKAPMIVTSVISKRNYTGHAGYR